MTNEINYSKQILIFVGCVIGVAFFISFISRILQVSLVGMTVIITMLAALVSGQNFVKEHDRAPNIDEAKRLTRLSFFFFIGLLLLFIILVMASPANKAALANESRGVIFSLIGFLVFYIGIAFFLIRWSYGGLTQKFADRSNR